MTDAPSKEKWGFTSAELQSRVEKSKREWLERSKELSQVHDALQYRERSEETKQMQKVIERELNKVENELNKIIPDQLNEKILQDQIYWQEWYKNEDTPIGPNEWSFEPIELRDDLSEEEIRYVQSLYDHTIPVPSLIFKRDPCLVWVRAKDRKGYAKHNPSVAMPGSTLVHRYVFQMAIGEIEEKTTIDHACGETSCINVRHLRLLDRESNRKYGDHRQLDINQFRA